MLGCVLQVEIITGEDAEEEPELELDDDPSSCLALNLSRWPLLVTVHQAGPCYVVDCTDAEEQCATAQLQCVVDVKGQVCGTNLSGARSAGIDPAALLEMVEVARVVGPRLIQAMDKYVVSTRK